MYSCFKYNSFIFQENYSGLSSVLSILVWGLFVWSTTKFKSISRPSILYRVKCILCNNSVDMQKQIAADQATFSLSWRGHLRFSGCFCLWHLFLNEVLYIVTICIRTLCWAYFLVCDDAMLSLCVCSQACVLFSAKSYLSNGRSMCVCVLFFF